MEAQPTKKTLVTKLSEVMAQVSHVPKTGRNNFHNYDYATEADIVAAVRQAMAERHLMLMPSVEKTEWRDVPKKSGGSEKLCTLTVKFSVLDGDTGERLDFIVLGEGQDGGDKATYKAMTGATKYALLKLFLIPTGDDPEKDSAPPPRAAPRQQSAATTTPKQAGDAETKRAAIRARLGRLWTQAKATGVTEEAFAAWRERVLGRKVGSDTMAEVEVAQLEGKFAQFLMDVAQEKRAH